MKTNTEKTGPDAQDNDLAQEAELVPAWSVSSLLIPSLAIWVMMLLLTGLALLFGFSSDFMAAEEGPVEITQLVILAISFTFAARASKTKNNRVIALLAAGTAGLCVGLFFAEVQSCEGLNATSFCLPRLFKRLMITGAGLFLLVLMLRNFKFLWRIKMKLLRPSFLWPGVLLFTIYLVASELEDFHYFVSEENLELLGMILLVIFSYRLYQPTLSK